MFALIQDHRECLFEFASETIIAEWHHPRPEAVSNHAV
jgi:hypothetical protein